MRRTRGEPGRRRGGPAPQSFSRRSWCSRHLLLAAGAGSLLHASRTGPVGSPRDRLLDDITARAVDSTTGAAPGLDELSGHEWPHCTVLPRRLLDAAPRRPPPPPPMGPEQPARHIPAVTGRGRRAIELVDGPRRVRRPAYLDRAAARGSAGVSHPSPCLRALALKGVRYRGSSWTRECELRFREWVAAPTSAVSAGPGSVPVSTNRRVS